MVEHLFCKQAVAGSNPIAGSIFPVSDLSLHFARLCNGSTSDSDSLCLGSTPSRAAMLTKRPVAHKATGLFSVRLLAALLRNCAFPPKSQPRIAEDADGDDVRIAIAKEDRVQQSAARGCEGGSSRLRVRVLSAAQTPWMGCA